jgi:hypothetical protein
MENGDAAILFVSDSESRRSVPALSARFGFRSFMVPWSQCRAGTDGILIRAGGEILVDGRLHSLSGVTVLDPILVAVLTTNESALERGRDLVASSGALWGHCGLKESIDRDVDERAERLGCGVVEFRPSSLPLMLAATPRVLARRRQKGVDGTRVAAVIERELSALADDPVATANPAVHRVVAPCAVPLGPDVLEELIDPLGRHAWLEDAFEDWPEVFADWLRHVRRRAAAPAALRLVDPDLNRSAGVAPFPVLFDTPQHIDTEHVDEATFTYLAPGLEPSIIAGDDRAAALHSILCRRRVARTPAGGATEPRFVEPGVGRACLVPGIQVNTHPELRDFTVLGIGLTPFSEGGYVEIGRKIDGKAALGRAAHRRAAAERLEEHGGRNGRVVAIIALPGDEIEMPDGSSSPSALVVRGFRCAYRIKQLDPLVCCLHSIQHTPLVNAFLAERARELRSLHGLSRTGTMIDDELLAQALEAQNASQEALRELLASRVSEHRADWEALVRRARLEAIETYAPALLATAKRRLAVELGVEGAQIRDEDYLRWFAASMGTQLAAWRRVRFLHDYHHPGVSRWHPGHLYTLGENNVTLLAEFPDLDTGVFVDDALADLENALQLDAGDVAILRERYAVFHRRDVQAAETVVRTLALVLFPDRGATAEAAAAQFRTTYAHA